MAERLKLVVAKRRLSGPDEESTETDTNSENTLAQSGTKFPTDSTNESLHNVSEDASSVASPNIEKNDNDSDNNRSTTASPEKVAIAAVLPEKASSNAADVKCDSSEKNVAVEAEAPSKEFAQEHVKTKAVTRGGKSSWPDSKR